MSGRAVSTAETVLRTRLAAAEMEAADLRALVADLNEQLDGANAAAVRMARRKRFLAAGQVAA